MGIIKGRGIWEVCTVEFFWCVCECVCVRERERVRETEWKGDLSSSVGINSPAAQFLSEELRCLSPENEQLCPEDHRCFCASFEFVFVCFMCVCVCCSCLSNFICVICCFIIVLPQDNQKHFRVNTKRITFNWLFYKLSVCDSGQWAPDVCMSRCRSVCIVEV